MKSEHSLLLEKGFQTLCLNQELQHSVHLPMGLKEKTPKLSILFLLLLHHLY
jgi:hypothetical protein